MKRILETKKDYEASQKSSQTTDRVRWQWPSKNWEMRCCNCDLFLCFKCVLFHLWSSFSLSYLALLMWFFFHSWEGEGRFCFCWVLLVFSCCCFDHLESVWEGSSSDHKPEAKAWSPIFECLLLKRTALALCALQSSCYERQQRQNTEMDSLIPWKVSKSILMCWGEALRHCSDKSLVKLDKCMMFWGGECIPWALTSSSHIYFNLNSVS